MSFKLQLVEKNLGLNFNVRYENLAKQKRPEVEAKAPNGSIVKERTLLNGVILPPGSTQRQWADDDGVIYEKSQLRFFYEGSEVVENTQTKVFQVTNYQPLRNYTDQYVIASYYEVFPHDNDLKKDFDQEVARQTNLAGMRKLWEHLKNTQQVARGEFCVSSKGFQVSDGYIRAIEYGNKWGLEIGVFKEEKIFEHLNESVPIAPTQKATSIKRIKTI